MKNRNLFLLTSGLAFPLLGAYAQKTPKPNIIYIMCDDMGYGDLGCYGQSYISTPNIDNMAKEGMRFTQAYAGSPVSAPSRASFMTGQHSGHCEVRGNKEYWRDAPVVMYGNNKEYTVVDVCRCSVMSVMPSSCILKSLPPCVFSSQLVANR